MSEGKGIILNVTMKAEAQIAAVFLRWLQEEHIPEMMRTGCFREYKLVKLLEVDDSEGPTYAIQYLAERMEDYHRYLQQHAAGLRQKSFDRWGEQFIAFRTLMEVVN